MEVATCIAHDLQGLTEMSPEDTVTSIDGITADDLISRGAMWQGLRHVDGGGATLPFVRMFYGVLRSISGKMPWGLGQHSALNAVHPRLHVVTRPDRVAAVYSILQEELVEARQNSHSRWQEPGMEPGWSKARVLRTSGAGE